MMEEIGKHGDVESITSMSMLFMGVEFWDAILSSARQWSME